MNISDLPKKLLKPEFWRKLGNPLKLGKEGSLISTVASTVGLELITQFGENFARTRPELSQVTNLMDKKVYHTLPMSHGDIDVRDSITLMPAGLNVIAGVRSTSNRSKHISNALAGVFTKVLMRNSGINGNGAKKIQQAVLPEPINNYEGYVR